MCAWTDKYTNTETNKAKSNSKKAMIMSLKLAFHKTRLEQDLSSRPGLIFYVNSRDLGPRRRRRRCRIKERRRRRMKRKRRRRRRRMRRNRRRREVGGKGKGKSPPSPPTHPQPPPRPSRPQGPHARTVIKAPRLWYRKFDSILSAPPKHGLAESPSPAEQTSLSDPAFGYIN